MPKYFDRVAETTISVGTGNLTLMGAISGYRRFYDIAGLNTPFYYVIENLANGEFEVGEGLLVDATTLARNVIHTSSNNNNLVAFQAGTKTVFCDIPADVLQFVETYVHDQAIPVTLWSITHHLNRYPSVTVVDSSGRVVLGGVTYINPDVLQLNFSGAFSGKAYLN